MKVCRIDEKLCIKCGACASVAPGQFSVRKAAGKVVRGATTPGERAASDAAIAMCPVAAISADGGRLSPKAPVAAPSRELYPQLAEVAEAARWHPWELPWSSFDRSRASPELKAIVREMAYFEQATFTATQRFLEAFRDDADFSQWVSVWFYEETRHPMIFLRWLELAGDDAVDAAFVAQGRETAPLLRSPASVLAVNIISEMTATEAYLFAARGRPEPLIAAIAERVAADESRHAASLFAYARRAIAEAKDPGRVRLEMLKVLQFWLSARADLNHPVNRAMQKVQTLLPAIGATGFAPPTERIAKAIGLLTGLPIAASADVPTQLLEHTRRVSARA